MALEVTIHKITSRYDESTVLWEGEAETLRAALEKAVAAGANLTDANLRDAYLTGANLTGANLTGANLRDAYLTGANLRGAYLTGANLTGANLRDAYLTDAYLTGANLRGANLRPFRDDLWAVLSAAPAEASAVLAALRAGTVDGSTYSGACACLVGTIANAAHCRYDELPTLKPDSGRLAEVWFTQIAPGQTPETHAPTKLAAEWVEDWLMRMRAAFKGSAETDVFEKGIT